MTPTLSIALNALFLYEPITFSVTILLIIVLNVLLLVGLLIWIPYSIKHKILSWPKLGIAFLASVAWAVGGGVAAFFTSNQWENLSGYFRDYTDISYYFESEELTGYLSLSLVAILAALFGFLTLYLLTRYLRQKSPPPSSP